MSDLPENERAGIPAGVPEIASVDAMSPGARLAAERQAHGLTIEQVASQLNLAPRQIVALEADNYAALPGMVIVRGFLRAYAKLLKLDPVPLLAVLVDKNSPASAVPMRHALSASFSESRLPSLTGTSARGKGLPVAAGAAVMVVAACVASYALGWWPESLTRRVGQFRAGSVTGGSTASDASTAAPSTEASPSSLAQTGAAQGQSAAADNVTGNAALPLQSSALPGTQSAVQTPLRPPTAPTAPGAATAVPATSLPSPAPALNTPPPAKGTLPAAAADPAGAVNPLVLNVRDDSWVEIKRADNTAVVGKIIKGGSVETFDVNEPVTVIIGNIAGVEASLRGAPLDLSSAANGNVARLRLK